MSDLTTYQRSELPAQPDELAKFILIAQDKSDMRCSITMTLEEVHHEAAH